MKVIIYLYNHTSNTIIFNNINSNIINPNNSILNNININYFSLASHKEYLYFKIYKYRIYIYIPQDLQIQFQKIAKRTEKEILIKYKDNLIYYI